MSEGDPADRDDHDVFGGGDNGATLPTGVGRQRLVVSGWMASHADTGVPGPHLALSTNDGQRPVVHARQVPALLSALGEVALRITQVWERDGRTLQVPAGPTVPPEPEDFERDEVRRRRRLAKLELLDLVRSRAADVLQAVLVAEDDDDAAAAIGQLLAISHERAVELLAHLQFRELTQQARRRQVSDALA